jgi:hypothetical protein
MHHIVAAAPPSGAAASALRIPLKAAASTSSIPAGTMTLDGKRTTAAQQGSALQDDASKEDTMETDAIAHSSRGRNLCFHPEWVKPLWQGRYEPHDDASKEGYECTMSKDVVNIGTDPSRS